MDAEQEKKSPEYRSHGRIRPMLVIYDLIIWLGVSTLILFVYKNPALDRETVLAQGAIFGAVCFLLRFAGRIYHQIWRYGGIQSYIRLLMTDAATFVIFYVLQAVMPVTRIRFVRCISMVSLNLLGAMGIRMVYRYAFKCGAGNKFLTLLLRVFGGKRVVGDRPGSGEKIPVAILGAGQVGIGLAEELSVNSRSVYDPRCFIDTDPGKIGRQIHGMPVFAENDPQALLKHEIQEIIFAIPQADAELQKSLYEKYLAAGYRIKVYDYPVMQTAGKKVLREFDIEELLFRRPVVMENEAATAYYRGKVILITGGGGSIGSEIARQLAKMGPKQLIILDVYENGAYDLQQELKIRYGDELDVRIEICSVCNEKALARVFDQYKPRVVIMAAAHKHVPLMEHNCIEAVENNVFGTLNTVRQSIRSGAERVIMVSTDKAVNPTNIMGATKRLCEMTVQAYSASGCKTTFSATRFGNVLGSAGSVIPLFKKQIAAGGPVTITDKRIIRYFMTIPEASQLVLQSGAMAKNGELFVLDMGQPVKILDLAENMIRLTGMEPGKDIGIRETGLRPGEKLYEELLVRTEELTKTENKLIFIEKDTPLTVDEIEEKLSRLKQAIATDRDEAVREVMAEVVPTYRKADK